MNDNPKPFRMLLEEARKTLSYAVEGVVIDFTEQVLARMEALAISRTMLAGKLNSSAAYVTKLLRGNSNNFTLESIVKVADALDSEVKLELVPKVSVEAWLTTLNNRSPQRPHEAAIWNATTLERVQTPLAATNGREGTSIFDQRNEIICASA